MTKRYITDEDGVTFSVVKDVEAAQEISTVRAEAGYNPNVNALLTLTNTGNGFVSVHHSYQSYKQDNYICLDYDEAEYLYYAIGEALRLRKKKAKKRLPDA